MKEIFRAIIEAARIKNDRYHVSVKHVIEVAMEMGYEEEEFINLINQGEWDRVIKMKFSDAARTKKEIDYRDTVITLM